MPVHVVEVEALQETGEPVLLLRGVFLLLPPGDLPQPQEGILQRGDYVQDRQFSPEAAREVHRVPHGAPRRLGKINRTDNLPDGDRVAGPDQPHRLAPPADHPLGRDAQLDLLAGRLPTRAHEDHVDVVEFGLFEDAGKGRARLDHRIRHLNPGAGDLGADLLQPLAGGLLERLRGHR